MRGLRYVVRARLERGRPEVRVKAREAVQASSMITLMPRWWALGGQARDRSAGRRRCTVEDQRLRVRVLADRIEQLSGEDQAVARISC